MKVLFFSKIFVLIATTVVMIGVLRIFSNYKHIEEFKTRVVYEEASTLKEFIKSFRKIYQDIFSQNIAEVNEQTIHFLPVLTINKISEELAKATNSKVTVRTVSDRPRNPVNIANIDELKAIEFFKNNRGVEDLLRKDLVKPNSYNYYSPLYITPGCLKCHGERKDTIDAIALKYDLAYGYKLGELRGLISITLSKDFLQDDLVAKFKQDLYVTFILVFVIILVMYIAIKKLRHQEDAYLSDLQKNVLDRTKELNYQKEYLRTILDSQNSIIIVTDGVKIVDVNSYFFDITGFRSLDLFLKVHNCICELFVKRDGFVYENINNENWVKYIDSRANQTHMVIINKSLEEKIFQVKVKEINSDKKRFVVVFNDITEIEHYKIALEKKVNEEVEKRRGNEQILIQQSKLASMGEMIGNIAHQWRQPLNTIGLIIQDFKEAYEVGEMNSEYIQSTTSRAVKIIQNMSRTINDFRNFYKPDKEKSEFYIKEAVESALEIIGVELEYKEIAVITEFDESIKIDGYKNEYSQVVINIIQNARDVLMNKIGRREIKITLEKGDNHFKSKLVIEDNGEGIDEAIIMKIFEPYFTTKHQAQGTGIGLFMSKMIIEKNMNGKLYAQNRGKGARFIIEV